ncbi:uncharacterized protein LOC112571140 [Pomacea canaliculata]|uniref:uncharacterized protein LOC112571140 n=1 Tax=Pomacea canaliculata TaxID=400727 RepID=UPI000D72A3E0|nr:uncharacterized protein LOC112571140 [Pomacea canaliculata]
MKGFVWRWMVALCVFTEIVAAGQHNVPWTNERNIAKEATCANSNVRYVNGIGRECRFLVNGDKESSDYDNRRNCFQTNHQNDFPHFLTFTLQQKYPIHRLVFYANENRLDRMDCLQVYFDDEVISTFPKNTKERILYLNRSESESRNVQILHFNRTCKTGGDEMPVINFCELEIYTCVLKKWGPRCDQPCHPRCITCSDDSEKCLDCTNDYWGPNCSHLCSRTCNGTDQEGYCEHITGKCEKGCRRGYWGHNCTNACGQGCGNTCNPSDGTCDCRHGWKPPRCEVPLCTCGEAECGGDNKYVFSELPRKINVAVGKNSTASTTLEDPKPVSGPACLANNGKTQSTMLPISASAPECMSTAEGDLKPFWQVDLGEQYVIAGILIDWDNQMKAIYGIRVILDGRQLYYTEHPMNDPFDLATNDLGQVVRLQRAMFRDNKQWDDPLLRICEVEVYTCRPGYYGPDCLGICDRPVCDNLQIAVALTGQCPKDRSDHAGQNLVQQQQHEVDHHTQASYSPSTVRLLADFQNTNPDIRHKSLGKHS